MKDRNSFEKQITVTVERAAAFIWRSLKCCFTHRSAAGYYYIRPQQKSINKRQAYIDLLCGKPDICIFSLTGSGMNYRSLSLLAGLVPNVPTSMERRQRAYI